MRQTLLLTAFGLAGWALSGLVLVLGPRFWSPELNLRIHALAAPLVFSFLTWVYYRFRSEPDPLRTALHFFSVALTLNILVIGLFFERNFAVFRNVLGTWVPLVAIFLASYLAGRLALASRGS